MMPSLPQKVLANLSEEDRAYIATFPWEGDWVVLNHPIEFMRFTLIYDGPLNAATAHNTRTENKHHIRKALHPQLVEVWQGHHLLKKELEYLLLPLKRLKEKEAQGNKTEIDQAKEQWDHTKESTHGAINRLLLPTDIGQFCFLPLVMKKMSLICELDILFLRNEPRGHIINSGGDIDNRLKVLFDALRPPQGPNELPAIATPKSEEDPFFCLLEDDSLITTVRVESERLLESSSTPKGHVRLVIRVTVKAERLSAYTLELVG